MNVARPSIDKTVRPNGPVGFCQGSRQNRRKEQYADKFGDRTVMICRSSTHASNTSGPKD